jgi:cytochrome c-type biogenesis protein CcmE
MKTKHIVALLAIAGLVGIMVVSFSDNLSQYTDFNTARTQGREVHVVAQWVKRDQANYDPATDCFAFYLQDSTGGQQLVHYYDPKPANFEQADKVVVIGHYDGAQKVFVADKMLMKCPSKYQNNQLPQPAKHYPDKPKNEIQG